VYNNDAQWVEYELDEISACHEQEMANARKSEGKFFFVSTTFYFCFRSMDTAKSMANTTCAQSVVDRLFFDFGTAIGRDQHNHVSFSV
jgi:hypothetical protein